MDSVGVGNNGFAIDHSRIIPDFFGASRQIIGHITHACHNSLLESQDLTHDPSLLRSKR
jgi:hypothetical protein